MTPENVVVDSCPFSLYHTLPCNLKLLDLGLCSGVVSFQTLPGPRHSCNKICPILYADSHFFQSCFCRQPHPVHPSHPSWSFKVDHPLHQAVHLHLGPLSTPHPAHRGPNLLLRLVRIGKEHRTLSLVEPQARWLISSRVPVATERTSTALSFSTGLKLCLLSEEPTAVLLWHFSSSLSSCLCSSTSRSSSNSTWRSGNEDNPCCSLTQRLLDAHAQD